MVEGRRSPDGKQYVCIREVSNGRDATLGGQGRMGGVGGHWENQKIEIQAHACRKRGGGGMGQEMEIGNWKGKGKEKSCKKKKSNARKANDLRHSG